MPRYKELSKAVGKREVPWAIYEKMGEEMRGKTDEEKSEISRRYKKLIIKPPVRKKNRPARRPKPLPSAKICGKRRLLFHRLFRLNVHIAARIRVDRIGRAQRAAGQQNVIARQLKLGHAPATITVTSNAQSRRPPQRSTGSGGFFSIVYFA